VVKVFNTGLSVAGDCVFSSPSEVSDGSIFLDPLSLATLQVFVLACVFELSSARTRFLGSFLLFISTRCTIQMSQWHGLRQRRAVDTMSDAVSEAVQEGKDLAAEIAHSLTLSWHEIQEWQQDNEYIHSGYRR
jgi:hypothetical protein